MRRKFMQVITNTGDNVILPSSSGIFPGGTTDRTARRRQAARSTDPADRPNDAQDAIAGRVTERLIDPVQLTRSAITVAGMSGGSFNSCRTRSSNGVNDAGAAARSYFGGRSDATARATTIDLPTPRSRATSNCGHTVRDQAPDQSPILH
jgi:hypothetical protein